MKWHWNDSLEAVAARTLGEKASVTSSCCQTPDIHIHAHSSEFGKKRGLCSAWIWCSECGSYSHLDGLPIHASWKNNSSVPIDKVSIEPDYLETVKDLVDEHLEEFLQND